MNRLLALLIVILLASLVFIEPVLANKFETIGGGVSGLSRKKIELLKLISLYAGSFLCFLAVIALITRKRFEGTITMYAGNPLDMALSVPIGLIVVGCGFIGLSYL